MKVKVGDEIYDGENQPVMVILSDADKENIKNMLPVCTKYCSFPEDASSEIVEKWMEI